MANTPARGLVVSLGSVEDEEGLRDVYVASVPEWADWETLRDDELWRSVVETAGAGFALFIAGDARGCSADVLGNLARYFIDHGCFSVSIWGDDCERVHDIFDAVDVGDGLADDDPIVLTTWHDDESLEDATLLFWFARPYEGKDDGAVRVILVVGDERLRADTTEVAKRHLAGLLK